VFTLILRDSYFYRISLKKNFETILGKKLSNKNLIKVERKMKVHFREQYGAKGEEFLYVTPLDQDTVVRVTIKGEKVARKFGLLKFFQKIFLPSGYPDSVSPDYLDYQKWDTLQAFASTISGNYCI
jgi:hypothetical protein